MFRFSSGVEARIGAALAGVLTFACLAFPAAAQKMTADPSGISSPFLSRCAGKFGAQLRAGDQAFPLLSLMGVPWMMIERSDTTMGGMHVAAIVTGIGTHSRRRGQIVGLRYRCLLDDKGEAVSFTWQDLLPERHEALPPAMVLRGTAYYQPRVQLPHGAELRVQLLDEAADPPELLTETVVRTSWEEPIPFVLRLPPDLKLEHRRPAIAVRLARGTSMLYGLREPQPLDLDRLQQPLNVVIDLAD